MRGEAYSLMLRYRELVHASGASAEWSKPLAPEELPSLPSLHAAWAAGLPDCCGTCSTGAPVRIISPGTWNRSSGPDFLHAEVAIGGARRRGAIHLTRCPEDWAEAGCMHSGAYDGVILHVSACAPQGAWVTQNSRREELPLFVLPPQIVRRALDAPFHAPAPAADEAASCPLSGAGADSIIQLLQSAAAFRLQRKRRRFLVRSEAVGESQARYEAWAETLGYSANKIAMGLLAARVPLVEARKNPEPLLFGTAGFLVPVLPERAVPEAHAYHSRIWEAWWPDRDRFELRGERALPWSFTGLRPHNHPHRRVAALAMTVAAWHVMENLLRAERLDALCDWLAALRHPYWSRYVSLPSAPGKKETALVGKERALDFAVNHVIPNDGSERAWPLFLHVRSGARAAAVEGIAASLWGDRADLCSLLRFAYVQQGLLQLREDFSFTRPEGTIVFARHLRAWPESCREA